MANSNDSFKKSVLKTTVGIAAVVLVWSATEIAVDKMFTKINL
jgi:hypothetical protein